LLCDEISAIGFPVGKGGDKLTEETRVPQGGKGDRVEVLLGSSSLSKKS